MTTKRVTFRFVWNEADLPKGVDPKEGFAALLRDLINQSSDEEISAHVEVIEDRT